MARSNKSRHLTFIPDTLEHMTHRFTRANVAALAVSALLIAVLLLGWRFERDLSSAAARAAQGSVLIATRCGTIEYQEAGTGMPLLVAHGGGGGHDQGMAFARPLTQMGIRVIAMSRFGYLRTPLPADASPAAQADAHACLLDALGIRQAAILGGSAGAPSMMQMAIRHPERVSALVLAVPLAYKPTTVADSVAPLSPLVDKMLTQFIASDFVFWLGLQVARGQVIHYVLGTPPDEVAHASPQERARVNAILDNIMPLSARAKGMNNDKATSMNLASYPLQVIRTPTLVFSARNDGFGTYANAQYSAEQIVGAKFIGFEDGGHALVGHVDEVMAEIAKLINASTEP